MKETRESDGDGGEGRQLAEHRCGRMRRQRAEGRLMSRIYEGQRVCSGRVEEAGEEVKKRRRTGAIQARCTIAKTSRKPLCGQWPAFDFTISRRSFCDLRGLQKLAACEILKSLAPDLIRILTESELAERRKSIDPGCCAGLCLEQATTVKTHPLISFSPCPAPFLL